MPQAADEQSMFSVRCLISDRRPRLISTSSTLESVNFHAATESNLDLHPKLGSAVQRWQVQLVGHDENSAPPPLATPTLPECGEQNRPAKFMLPRKGGSGARLLRDAHAPALAPAQLLQPPHQPEQSVPWPRCAVSPVWTSLPLSASGQPASSSTRISKSA